jgi:hypothetical protein
MMAICVPVKQRNKGTSKKDNVLDDAARNWRRCSPWGIPTINSTGLSRGLGAPASRLLLDILLSNQIICLRFKQIDNP